MPIYNQGKNQIIYQVKTLESDSDIASETDSSDSRHNHSDSDLEVVRIDHAADVLNQGLSRWQKIIGDYTVDDIGEIIEMLSGMTFDEPENEEYRSALIEARDYKLQKSMDERKRVVVKRDLNTDQFGKRVAVDYDKTVEDEQYRIIAEGHARCETENQGERRVLKPPPKNFGTRKMPVNMSVSYPTTRESPDDWLFGGA